jgi:hypothetical protein
MHPAAASASACGSGHRTQRTAARSATPSGIGTGMPVAMRSSKARNTGLSSKRPIDRPSSTTSGSEVACAANAASRVCN